MLNFDDKIYIAGHTGLVGSAITRKLKTRGFSNLLTCTHNELDLTNQADVEEFFKKEKPTYVIMAAATVGGIHANSKYPADFIYQNLMIETNVIHSAYKNKIRRLLFLGSSCVYPKSAKQPMEESALLTDVLEPTNEPYAIAKISGIKLCESYNRQYGTDYRSVMPTNLYGINDNFHPENSHVIPCLMRRIHQAKINNQSEVTVWGTGKVMREFMYVDDMAEASLFVLELDYNNYQANIRPTLSHINIGTGIDISIRELAQAMCNIIGYQGKLLFDTTKPDGPTKKLLNISRLKNMGWTYSVDLNEGLKKTYQWYLKNKNEFF